MNMGDRMTVDLFKIMSDETRLRILVLLFHQDLCVCELVHVLEASQPKISKHIAKIRSLKFVTTRRNEQFIYYSLNKDNKLMMQLLNTIVSDSLNKEPFVIDLQRLNDMEDFVCTRKP